MISNNLQNKCNLFVENLQILKKNFKWEYAMMHRLGAVLYTKANLSVNVEAIKYSKDIIKKNTGILSAFKDTTYFALSTLLSLEPNPEDLFRQTVNIYDAMKKMGFYSSPYLTLAAFSIAKQSDQYEERSIVDRAKEFYSEMKKEHRFLTTAEDYGYAAMLATSDLSVSHAIHEMESCYELLRSDFGAGNPLQSLTHVLTLGEEAANIKCQRAKLLYRRLADKGCKISKYNELTTLGLLVLITEDVESITDQISEVYQVLLDKKGLGSWSITKQERTMFAAALVTDQYIIDRKENPLEMTLANSITNIVIAQQTAMIIAATSASVAATSSSSD